MQYQQIESVYGPEPRPCDWKVLDGETRPGGGFLHILGQESATIVLGEPVLPGGGDVERTLHLNVEDFSEAAHLTIHFNCPPNDIAAQGFRFSLTPETLTVFLDDKQIAEEKHDGWKGQTEHQFRLATLGTRYAVWYQDRIIASGNGPSPFRRNEGTMAIVADRVHCRLLGYEEQFITDPRPVPDWEKTECLYRESFTAESLKENWLHNHFVEGSGPEVIPDGFRFRRMNNSFLRQSLEAPLAMECVVRPVPNPDFPSGVTDLITIWMADAPGEGFAERIERMNAEGRAGLTNLLDIPFYWVDFGGSNNITTRLRKNPGRRLMRQFQDRPRLLQRDRTYRLTVAQQNGFVEFHVDGTPLIRQYDAKPLTQGHIGFRAFCADLELHECSVWRIES